MVKHFPRAIELLEYHLAHDCLVEGQCACVIEIVDVPTFHPIMQSADLGFHQFLESVCLDEERFPQSRYLQRLCNGSQDRKPFDFFYTSIGTFSMMFQRRDLTPSWGERGSRGYT